MCTSNNIAITKTAEKVKEGWEGKAKGLSQVVWGRGVINSTNIKQYLLNRKKDEFGGIVVNYETSLRHDFMNEEGIIQHIAKCAYWH